MSGLPALPAEPISTSVEVPPPLSPSDLQTAWDLALLHGSRPGEVGMLASPGDIVMGVAACRDPAEGRLIPHSAWPDAAIHLVGEEALVRQLTTTTPMQTVRCKAAVPMGWPHDAFVGLELEVVFYVEGWRTPRQPSPEDLTAIGIEWARETRRACEDCVRERLYDEMLALMDFAPPAHLVDAAVRDRWESFEGRVFRQFDATPEELEASWTAWREDTALRRGITRRVAHTRLVEAFPDLASLELEHRGDTIAARWAP